MLLTPTVDLIRGHSQVPVKMMFACFFTTADSTQHSEVKPVVATQPSMCDTHNSPLLHLPFALKMKHLTCHEPAASPPSADLKWEGIPCAGFKIADRWRALHWQRRCEMGQTIGWCPQRYLGGDRAKFWLKETVLKISLLRNTVWPGRNDLSLSFLLLYTVLNQQRKPKITIRWIQPRGRKCTGTAFKQFHECDLQAGSHQYLQSIQGLFYSMCNTLALIHGHPPKRGVLPNYSGPQHIDLPSPMTEGQRKRTACIIHITKVGDTSQDYGWP